MTKRIQTIDKNLSLILISMVWLFISVIISALVHETNAESFLRFICLETLVFFILIINNFRRAKKTVFSIVTLFILMMFLFLEGQVLLEVFHLNEYGILSGKFTTYELIRGILKVHIFIAVFTLACSFFRTENTPSLKTEAERTLGNDRIAMQVGYIITACAAPFEMYVNLKKIQFVRTDGYASLYQEAALSSIPSGIKILSYFFLPGCFYIFYSSKNKSVHEYISLILIGLHCFIEILIGYRSMAITPILLVVYGLTVKSGGQMKKGNKKKIILLCAVMLFLIIIIFPLMRATRNSGGISELSFDEIFSAENNELFATVSDMGKSLQTVIYTQKYVPSQYPYRYGYTYLMNLTEAIPNFFWSRHPAEVYGSLGKWITKIVDYDFYKFGGSIGYSCVAEAYINFGNIGIVVFAFVLGAVLQSVENKVEVSGNAVYFASWTIVANYLLMYPRGELSNIVRGFFWYMLLPLLFTKIYKGKSEKSVYGRHPDKKQI